MLKIETKELRKKMEAAGDDTRSFSDEDMYILDTMGLCQCKGFLRKDEIDRCNTLIDEWLVSANPSPYKFPFFMLDYLFCRIMTKNWIVKACRKTVGPWYRLDHCIGIQQPGKIKSARTGNWVDQGYELGNIHGGNFAGQGSLYYQPFADRAWSGHMTFGISLINPDEGGFCYIPGSHKQATTEYGGETFKNLLGHDFSHPLLNVPKLEPGDAVFFPENLNHGFKPIKRGTKRRVIYYVFVPGFACWRPYEEIKHYTDLARTEQELRILRPPYVAFIEDDDRHMSDNRYRTET